MDSARTEPDFVGTTSGAKTRQWLIYAVLAVVAVVETVVMAVGFFYLGNSVSIADVNDTPLTCEEKYLYYYNWASECGGA